MVDLIVHIQRIRHPTELDVEELNKYWSLGEGFDSSPAEYDIVAISNYIADPSNVLLIAYTSDQKPVGVALATIIKKPYKDSDFLYIDEVDVHPNFRKQGIAKAMLRELMQIAKELKLDEVWVGTEPDNIAANALYSSIDGYEKEQHIGYTYDLS